MGALIAFALNLGIPARFAKAAVFGTLIALGIAILLLGKCAYDKSVIDQARTQAGTPRRARHRQGRDGARPRHDPQRQARRGIARCHRRSTGSTDRSH
jgi:hypothetical protein